jgi:hypothetical protein
MHEPYDKCVLSWLEHVRTSGIRMYDACFPVVVAVFAKKGHISHDSFLLSAALRSAGPIPWFKGPRSYLTTVICGSWSGIRRSLSSKKVPASNLDSIDLLSHREDKVSL